MGEQIDRRERTGSDRRRYREALRRCLATLERMLADGAFAKEDFRTGLEMELNLLGPDLAPAMSNEAVLSHLADPEFQTELGQFTIELNAPPRRINGAGLRELEGGLRRSLNHAESRARELDARIAMIGILPTVRAEHLEPAFMSSDPRYAALDEAVLAARGEDVVIDIEGPERLELQTGTITPEAACTSVQLHLQVSVGRFVPVWNAAQALAGPQLALAANSPFLCGRRLWSETRIDLFSQSTDTRPTELREQGVRPVVTFGEQWITSPLDLWTENTRFYPALLPRVSTEDPVAVYESGGVPRLAELSLQNGTIWRWNRPVYDVADGAPHLRVENRVLPAGPTVVDTVANAAFFYGVLVSLVLDGVDLAATMPFEDARANFETAARVGADARLRWPGHGEVGWDELVLAELLPRAHDGLRSLEVDDDVRERYLGVVEARARSRVNGAAWQVSWVRALEEGGATRAEALDGMLERYLVGMHANEPVHTWALPD